MVIVAKTLMKALCITFRSLTAIFKYLEALIVALKFYALKGEANMTAHSGILR